MGEKNICEKCGREMFYTGSWWECPRCYIDKRYYEPEKLGYVVRKCRECGTLFETDDRKATLCYYCFDRKCIGEEEEYGEDYGCWEEDY